MAVNRPIKNLIKPSDAVSWVSCIRRAWLDMQQRADYEADAFSQLLAKAGLQHEARILLQLQNQHQVHHASSFEHTKMLMQQGVPVIYQAKLQDCNERLIGFPDFLIRHKSGQYQAADAKLTQSENKKALRIQLGFYRRLLPNELPAIVFLGDGRTAAIGDEADSQVNAFITGMRLLGEQSEQPEVRYSYSKCRICPYYSNCRPQFDAKGDISLLYGIHGQTADDLAAAGIETISQLAAQNAENIPDMPYLSSPGKKQRAILQARSFLKEAVFQLNKVVLPQGTWVHFDIEDNPLTPSRERHVYLWGFLVPPYGRDDFDYTWTDDEKQDYEGWLAFLKKIDHYHTCYSRLILAHYSNHEKATIKKYAERYDMIEHATVQWLLGKDSPLFDMQKIVLGKFVLPLQGYGLKDICKHPKLVNFQWENKESGSQWSVVQFNRFLLEKDPQEKQRMKTEILGYNRDDVTATRKLEEWLRSFLISNR